MQTRSVQTLNGLSQLPHPFTWAALSKPNACSIYNSLMPVSDLCGGGRSYHRPACKVYWARPKKWASSLPSAHNAEDIERKDSVWKKGYTTQDSYDVDNIIVRPEAGDKDSCKGNIILRSRSKHLVPHLHTNKKQVATDRQIEGYANHSSSAMTWCRDMFCAACQIMSQPRQTDAL